MPFKVFFSRFLVKNLRKNKNYLTFGCNIEIYVKTTREEALCSIVFVGGCTDTTNLPVKGQLSREKIADTIQTSSEKEIS